MLRARCKHLSHLRSFLEITRIIDLFFVPWSWYLGQDRKNQITETSRRNKFSWEGASIVDRVQASWAATKVLVEVAHLINMPPWSPPFGNFYQVHPTGSCCWGQLRRLERQCLWFGLEETRSLRRAGRSIWQRFLSGLLCFLFDYFAISIKWMPVGWMAGWMNRLMDGYSGSFRND